MTEREKMLAGQPFNSRDAELLQAHHNARRLLADFNASDSDEADRRQSILKSLLGGCGEGVWIEPPFHCDYGAQIALGDRVFINFNCIVLDGNQIDIGADTVIGPAVQIYATEHPMEPAERLRGLGKARSYVVTSRPVSIGQDCWIGGGSIILAGVTIGQGTTIGAGSVVTKSVPAGVFAAGNPCRVVRRLSSA